MGIKVTLEDKIPGCKYFKWKEFLWLNSIMAYAVIPNEQVRLELIQTAKIMDRLREEFGIVKVTSGYRPPKYNEWIGGAQNSTHTLGMACDFIIVGKSVEEIKKEIMARSDLMLLFRIEADTINWIHVDRRGQGIFYANPNRRTK